MILNRALLKGTDPRVAASLVEWTREVQGELRNLLDEDPALWFPSSSPEPFVAPRWAPLDLERGLVFPLAEDVMRATLGQWEMDGYETLFVEQDGKSGWIVAPFLFNENLALVATCETSSEEAPSRLRLMRLFQKEWEQRKQLARLQRENEAFAMQVTEDFEQLTFLRRMAEQLETTNLSLDLLEMAENILPVLLDLIHAESLVLILEPAEGDADQRSLFTYWTGPVLFSDAICNRIVSEYRNTALRRPVVHNHYQERPEAYRFPEVRELMLVPVNKSTMLMGWLMAFNHRPATGDTGHQAIWQHAPQEFGTCEATLLSSAGSILASHAYNVELFREKEQLLVSMVRSLVSAIEAKDEYTSGHSERVALYSKCLGAACGLDEKACDRLYLTGLLHDIGKIGVSDATLKKPGSLTDEEFEEVRRHPEKGWYILQDLTQLRYVMPGVVHHHERFDGKGYPDGLQGAQIPLDGRILGVCDAFDAMTSDRPYRPGMSLEKATAILQKGAGTQWDPEIAETFLEIMPTILHIRETHKTQPRLPRAKRPVAAELDPSSPAVPVHVP